MPRPHLVLLPPLATRIAMRDVALGIRALWRCALFAAGVDVVAARPGASAPKALKQATPPALCAVLDAFVSMQLEHHPLGFVLTTGIVRRGPSTGGPERFECRGELPTVTTRACTILAERVGVGPPGDSTWSALLPGPPGDIVEKLRSLGRRHLARHRRESAPRRARDSRVVSGPFTFSGAGPAWPTPPAPVHGRTPEAADRRVVDALVAPRGRRVRSVAPPHARRAS
jgi:hypothetical protein